jgi:hypothetical protein
MQIAWLKDDKLIAWDKKILISDVRANTKKESLSTVTPRKSQFLIPREMGRQIDVWENSQGRFLAMRGVVRRKVGLVVEIVTDVWDIDKGEIVQSFKMIHDDPYTDFWAADLLLCGRLYPSVWQLGPSAGLRHEMVGERGVFWQALDPSQRKKQL